MNDLELLDQGYIPNQFNYVIDSEDNIDFSKLIYDDYHTFDYYAKRFKYYKSLPGFEQYIHEIVLKNLDKMPLDELNKIKKQSDEFELDIKINNLNIINE